jgi:hypothetical protein
MRPIPDHVVQVVFRAMIICAADISAFVMMNGDRLGKREHVEFLSRTAAAWWRFSAYLSIRRGSSLETHRV